MRVYLDNAASTPISKEVLDTMTSYLRDCHGNPSSIHACGRKARALIEKSRKTIANYLQASVGEIFFTSGGTESNNMAIKCAVRDLGITRIISSPTEHHCILHTLSALGHGITLEYVKVDEKGCIDYDNLEELLKNSDKKTLVSLMYANNEIGTLLEFERVSNLCQENKALFHCDSVQAIGHYPFDVQKVKIDFLSGSAHKFHGPKGIGFIYINNDNSLKPFITGGAQERNMRAGTENISGIVGLAKALDLATSQMENRRTHIEEIRAYLIEQLRANFDDIQFNGDYDGQYLYTVLSVSLPPTPKTDLIIFSLDIAGISASGGSACSSGAEAKSHVLSAIKPNDTRNSVRFSFSHYNTKEEIDFVVEKLKGILPKQVEQKANLVNN